MAEEKDWGFLACTTGPSVDADAEPGECSACAARIVFSPAFLAKRRAEHPGIEFRLLCYDCAAPLVTADVDLSYARQALRDEWGAIVDLISDDDLRQFFRERARKAQ